MSIRVGKGMPLRSDQEASDVAKRFLIGRHLAQVIAPGVRFKSAARVSLAGDDDCFSTRVQPGKALGRHDELNLRALFPKVLGEVVGEEQGVIALSAAEGVDGGVQPLPLPGHPGLEPCAGVETIGARL